MMHFIVFALRFLCSEMMLLRRCPKYTQVPLNVAKAKKRATKPKKKTSSAKGERERKQHTQLKQQCTECDSKRERVTLLGHKMRITFFVPCLASP